MITYIVQFTKDDWLASMYIEFEGLNHDAIKAAAEDFARGIPNLYVVAMEELV